MAILAVSQAQVALSVDPPLNAAAGVKYIGSDQCTGCHESQHSSFQQTLHSRAAQVTDVAVEPKPGRFDHQPSGHSYEVDIVNGKMVHREVLRDESGEQLAMTDKTMSVTLGSGTNAKSYLHRAGPFHIQSPITYFSDDQQWSMSPGYDQPVHRSFRRTITVSCVFCHVGSITQVQRNPYKFEIVESQIGCERCHGPGQLHQQRHQDNPNWQGADDTIVNPSTLSRELSEAICQQCHCQGVQAINVSGKNDWDYRPGLRFTDYRVDFQFRRGDNSMRLVGHVEQMHASKCYTETATLTCVTCHDPHDPPTVQTAGESGLIKYYRDKCYQCHEDRACGKPRQQRLAENENDCASCHMPRGETNVSHFALHDHRIGIHTATADRSTGDAATFTPILDISHLSEAEQRRLNGLAMYEIHRRHGGNPNFADFDFEATGELIRLKSAGQGDAEVDAALVWLARNQGQIEIAENIARELLSIDDESMPRIVATNVLAQITFSRREFQEALSLYRTLDGLHRDGQDTYYLGLSEQNTRNTEKAIEALKRSIDIEPSQVGAHAALHAIYLSTGRPDEANRHKTAADKNRQLQERYAKDEQRKRERAAAENAR